MIARKCDRCGVFFIPTSNEGSFLDFIKNTFGYDDFIGYEIRIVKRSTGRPKLDLCDDCYKEFFGRED